MEEFSHCIKMFFTSYIGGICIFVIGIFQIRKMLNSNERIDDSILQPYIRGWAVGIGSTVLGLVVIILKLFGYE